MSLQKPIGIFYEHPTWFKPLFAELEKRKIPFIRIKAEYHQYNPAENNQSYSLLINRMSSSAYLRGNGQGILHTLNFLEHIERLGIPTINGSVAQRIESSKARQLTLLAALGLKFPRTRVINHINQVLPAALSLNFPLVVKANIGGSGAGIVRFDTLVGLQTAIDRFQLSLGLDKVALVQEYIAPKDDHIVRVETLNGKYLYALKVYTTGESFNLCPAELCQVPAPYEADACLTEVTRKGIQVEAYTPPPAIIADVERIAKRAGLDVGGIEYLVGKHDHNVYYYDINALSNFVANAPDIIGFDPYLNFVDYIEDRLEKTIQTTKESLL
ncbi:MAG: hypothetical protein KF846_10050 [Cyclobacteriaceae bacterium]|nr:hypothetical protein [Cyclobacteriaceae bacterium]